MAERAGVHGEKITFLDKELVLPGAQPADRKQPHAALSMPHDREQGRERMRYVHNPGSDMAPAPGVLPDEEP